MVYIYAWGYLIGIVVVMLLAAHIVCWIANWWDDK